MKYCLLIIGLFVTACSTTGPTKIVCDQKNEDGTNSCRKEKLERPDRGRLNR